jgi:hypothetical protein
MEPNGQLIAMTLKLALARFSSQTATLDGKIKVLEGNKQTPLSCFLPQRLGYFARILIGYTDMRMAAPSLVQASRPNPVDATIEKRTPQLPSCPDMAHIFVRARCRLCATSGTAVTPR